MTGLKNVRNRRDTPWLVWRLAQELSLQGIDALRPVVPLWDSVEKGMGWEHERLEVVVLARADVLGDAGDAMVVCRYHQH